MKMTIMEKEPSRRCLLMLWLIRLSIRRLKDAEGHAIYGYELRASQELYKLRDALVELLKDEDKPKGPPDDIEEPA